MPVVGCGLSHDYHVKLETADLANRRLWGSLKSQVSVFQYSALKSSYLFRQSRDDFSMDANAFFPFCFVFVVF